MKACDWSEYKRCIVEGSGTRTVPIKTDGAQYPRIVEMLLARSDLDANVQNKVAYFVCGNLFKQEYI